MFERKLSTTNGVKTFFALSAYFLLMQVFGLQDEAFLRFANLFIIFYFVRETTLKMIQKDNSTLLGVFFSGIITSAIGVLLSVIAFAFYITFIKGTAYLTEVGNTFIPLGDSSSLMQYSFALVIEGMCSCVFVSMYIMQKFKNSIGIKPVKMQ